MKKPSNRNFSDWLDSLRAQGRSSFIKAEAQKAYGARASGLPMVLHRLLKAERIAKPKTGFYLILDPPYRVQGCQPPDWFVDALMKHLGLPYYVGGLSAAAHYGATHQAVQELQVVVPGDHKGLRPIRCGRVRIRLLLKSAFGSAVTQKEKTQTGYYQVASPEMAAWDAVYFMSSLGGPDQVGTALRDMAESLDAGRLEKLAKAQEDEVTSRRLGWILQKTGSPKLAEVLRPKDPSKLPWRKLAPGAVLEKRHRLNEDWRLMENHKLDLD
jgi:predicted transcriptional regulator of viral defense system